MGSVVGHVTGHVMAMPTLPLEQRTLEAAQLAEKFYIQNFKALLKIIKTPKT